MNQAETIVNEPQRSSRPIPRWVRNVVLPLLPAGLAFGPLLMVMPGMAWINFAGAIILGFALSVAFVLVGRCLFPPQ
jgi:hypothetical protein